MSLLEVNWQQIAAALAVLMSLSGAIYWVLQTRLGRRFVAHSEFREIKGQLEAMQTASSDRPTKSDFQGLQSRIERVESNMTGLQAQISDVKIDTGAIKAAQAGLVREVSAVAHQFSLLNENLLKRRGE